MVEPIELLNLLFTTSLGQFQILYKVPLMDEQRFNSIYFFHAYEHIVPDIQPHMVHTPNSSTIHIIYEVIPYYPDLYSLLNDKKKEMALFLR